MCVLVAFAAIVPVNSSLFEGGSSVIFSRDLCFSIRNKLSGCSLFDIEASERIVMLILRLL